MDFPSIINDTLESQLTSLTDPKKTIDTLCNSFVYNGRINDRELCNSLIVHMKTNNDLRYQLSSHRLSTDQVVWMALINIVNDALFLDYNRRYQCTTEQLKQWLSEYGNGYASLSEAVTWATRNS